MLDAALTRFRRLVHRVAADDRGAGLVEYALLVALIAIVCFSALAFFGSGSGNSLDTSRSCLEAAYDGQALPSGCD